MATTADDVWRLLGELAEAQFSRQFGAIRHMGPAKLEREAPWLNPESIAEAFAQSLPEKIRKQGGYGGKFRAESGGGWHQSGRLRLRIGNGCRRRER